MPCGLNRFASDVYEIWQAPNLFLAQACGYPLTHRLAGKVRLMGTPCYDAPGCEGPLYRSLFIVRSDCDAKNLSDALPARVAINGMDSYSGWHALRKVAQSLGLNEASFADTVISNSHANSIDLVRDGKADLAAIDCVTHVLIGDVQPERLVGTRVLEQSPPAPGLPLITRADMSDQDVRLMMMAIKAAFEDIELSTARRTLRLSGIERLPLPKYIKAMAA